MLHSCFRMKQLTSKKLRIILDRIINIYKTLTVRFSRFFQGVKVVCAYISALFDACPDIQSLLIFLFWLVGNRAAAHSDQITLREHPASGFFTSIIRHRRMNVHCVAVEVGPETEFKPGIWHNMPVITGDHLFWMNWTGNKYVVLKTWDRFMQRARMLPDGEDNQ